MAVLLPVPVGVKLNVTRQLAAGAKDPVQAFPTIEKSPGFVPVNATDVKLKELLPLFVAVMFPLPLVCPMG